MNAIALFLLLAAGGAGEAADGEILDESAPTQREFRAGAGAMTVLDVDGVAPAAEVGLELEPWAPLGLRFTFGAAMRVGWGSVYLAPELVYRVLPRGAFSPYLTAGVQAAVLNLTKDALGVPDVAESRAAATGAPVSPDPTGGGTGPSPLRFSAGPQAGIGVSFPLAGTVVDVGGRYNLQFWDGQAYSGFAILLTVVGPVTF
jgi:hypothetical protein